MIPRPAQYLLRFDDLCPAMDRDRWEPFRELLQEFQISPILAVVPQNEDAELSRSPYDPDFWDQMKRMEAQGAAIGLHGYRHVCASQGNSLLGMHRTSEFAGVPLDMQREWLGKGLAILRAQGLNPRIWVAPRHGFDANTLRALREHGLDYISDGFARTPFQRHGVTWIPQQLWSPVLKPAGLWTICIHPSTTPQAELGKLRTFLNEHADQFTSFQRVAAEYRAARLSALERIYEQVELWRVRRRRRMRQS